MKANHKNAIGTVIAAALLAAFATGVQAEDVAQAKACMTKATADAVAAVNAPELTGLYEAKAGGNTRFASIR